MCSVDQRIYAVRQALLSMADNEEERKELMLMLVDELDRALEEI